MRDYEIPMIVTVRAPFREDAVNALDDVADAMGDVFGDRGIMDATALVTIDHNVMDRLQIDVAGVPVGSRG